MYKIFRKSGLLAILSLLLTAAILFFPRQALLLASDGLLLWFKNMVPALFPFMVISGLMIRLQLTEHFAVFFRPFLGRLFLLHDDCLYVIFTGFLCGFPMGAKIIADLYREGRLNRPEAELLLAFCNNIGPVYFTGFALAVLPPGQSLPVCFFGMYGLSFLYGLFLRHVVFRHRILLRIGPSRRACKKPPALAAALDASIASGISSITKLGGYMIFFNLLTLLPQLAAPCQALLSGIQEETFSAVCRLFLEVSGGISSVAALKGAQKSIAWLILTLLPFGGLSCIAQTGSMLADTDLPLRRYVFHKGIQTLIAALYYGICLNFPGV